MTGFLVHASLDMVDRPLLENLHWCLGSLAARPPLELHNPGCGFPLLCSCRESPLVMQVSSSASSGKLWHEPLLKLLLLEHC